MDEQQQLNHILGSSEITWKLSDLYDSPEDTKLQADLLSCQEEATAIKNEFHGRVNQLEADDLLILIQRLEGLDELLSRLATYAFLNFTTQIDNAPAGALQQKIEEEASACEKQVVFFELEWNQLSDSRASELLACTTLNKYHHYLSALRRFRPHQLSETEEALLLEYAPVGNSAWNTLFDKVIGGLRFGTLKRTEEEVLTDLYDSDRSVRKTAAYDLTCGLKDQSHILTHIFNTLAADKMISDRLRCHPSWVSSMNLANELSDSTVDALVDAVMDRTDIVQRYYRIKREILGLNELLDYDRYAPLPGLPETKITWSECQDMVLSAFNDFSPALARHAENFFHKKWIHAPIIQGKRGGAFAHPCVPDVHPFVLVNYTGNVRDVSTVAHELGHGVHQVLAARQGHFNSDTPLVLAETASVFAELLVFQNQLTLLTRPEQKKAFICQKLESIFATVFRQVAMNRFEKRMHEGRRKHGELSAELLGRYWIETQREMFGDSVTLSDDYSCWWSYIPHFLATPGYVYSYAFGELLVLALYELHLEDSESFAPRYLELLAAGGSASPAELLAPFNIDLDHPDFWKQGLNLIDKMLSHVEALP
ncbi:MAG: M3 family oligoendopeptidase [Desulfobulbaceae bacterium]|uniref:M3 family oligoendopeptidase n=1 Tax=Candidatus Desulfatifera sulfidica TaxID=2841691 RepID=A0A8J6NC50_9BACT|nr:M3 family oligoendopeptidase [Candidatus Desulfatifera sulfidica]